MVDFKKLKNAKQKSLPTDPVEIFRRLPRTPKITDLYSSQAQVLEDWYKRKDQNDVVLKLHTGGGKTLVGLLIAQSIINEKKEPVIYLAPTIQLVNQTIEKAEEYGIPAVEYLKSTDFQDEFLTAKSILVCTYQALFNGKSRFGAPGSSRNVLKAGAIILDDAHVSLSSIRDSFTLTIESGKDIEDYNFIAGLFRSDFKKLGKIGTYDDVISGKDSNVLEVPYWSWKANSTVVNEFLRKRENNIFVWPLVRDSIDYCHCLITRSSIVITPILPLVDLIPTFYNCKSRIYMSATIADDSSIIRTFGADSDSIAAPITSRSLAGVSERLILCPELMDLDKGGVRNLVKNIIAWSAKNVGTVVLTPSGKASLIWQDVATVVDDTNEVEIKVKELQDRLTKGPFVFANRYDGIDLPGDACRTLVMAGLPKGTSEYDLYRSSVFLNGEAINSTLSQRIEQGIGRAARGPGDYCVVIITEKDLISWISRTSNVKYLTSSTRAQLEIGLEVSKDVNSLEELGNTILSCINRDPDWIAYHADALADAVDNQGIDNLSLETAGVEQKALKLWRDGYYEKAISTIKKYCLKDIDSENKAWLLQLAARIALYWGRSDLSQELQELAFSNNRYLLRPKIAPTYQQISVETKQVEKIVGTISDYFPRKGLLATYEEIITLLVPESTSNQFEESLMKLGELLGFTGERPEKIYGGEGGAPDVIWLLDNSLALVIEVKSRKKVTNALTKEELGQLLSSTEWFKKKYSNYSFKSVSVHPSVYATKSTTTDDVYVLTLDSLNVLISNTQKMLEELCDSEITKQQMLTRCSSLLKEYNLTSENIGSTYLQKFKYPE